MKLLPRTTLTRRARGLEAFILRLDRSYPGLGFKISGSAELVELRPILRRHGYRVEDLGPKDRAGNVIATCRRSDGAPRSWKGGRRP